MKITIVDASIIGKTHQKLLYNNQDAYCVLQTDELTVGVICDGCGSAPHSEVGAKLSAQFIGNYLFQNKGDFSQLGGAIKKYLEQLAHLSVIVADTKAFLNEYCLFTVVGFVQQTNQVDFFYKGDGLIYIDGETIILDKENRPDYLAYQVINNEPVVFDHFERPLQKNTAFLIASDGLLQLGNQNDLPLDTHLKKILNDEELQSNPIALNKLLSHYSKQGLLGDDTTVICCL